MNDDGQPRSSRAVSSWAITGGGGYVGSALAERIAASGRRVRILSRRPGPEHAVVGDLSDREALATLVTGAEVVVHLAAYVHRAARSEAEIAECRRTNVEGTRELVDAIATHAPGAFLVFVSSASVYAASDAELHESSPCAPSTVYGRTKLEAEHIVLDARRAGRIRACVLRPAMIFGPGAPGNLERLARLARRGLLVRFRGRPARKSLLPIESAVGAILRVAERPDAADGGIFNVTGGPPMSIDEIASAIAAAFGRRVHPVKVPRRPIQFAAHLADAVLRVLPLRAPALVQLVSSYASSVVLDDTRFRDTFAFVPAVAVPEAITRAFRAR
jgi:nucleoside-diphosphate-sugar epimerase